MSTTKNKLIKFLIVGFIIFIAGIMNGTSSKAFNINTALTWGAGTSHTISVSEQKNSNYLYCVQNRKGYGTTFTVGGRYHFEGDKMTDTLYGTSANCTDACRSGVYYIMSCILSRNEGYHGGGTAAQKDLKSYLYTFRDFASNDPHMGPHFYSVTRAWRGANFGWSRINGTYQNEYHNYLKGSPSGDSENLINLFADNAKRTITETGSEIIGPFAVTTETGGVKITDCEIDANYSTGEKIEGWFNAEDGSMNSKYFSIRRDSPDGEFVSSYGKYADLPLNTDLYIENSAPSSIIINGIGFKGQGGNSGASVPYADMIILNSSGQDFIAAVGGRKTTAATDKDNVVFPLDYVNLTVKKSTPMYIGQQDWNMLENAEFVLSHGNKFATNVTVENGMYVVKEWSQSYVGLTDEQTLELQNSAYKFVIPKDGLTIHLKKDGNSIYGLTEVKAPDGSIGDALGVGESNGLTIRANDTSLRTDENGVCKNQILGSKLIFEIGDNASASIIMTNPRMTLLIVHKVDKFNNEIPLDGVEFYFNHRNKLAQVQYDESTGHYKITGFVDNENQVTEKLVTGKNGHPGELAIEIPEDLIEDHLQHIYGLTEVNNPNEKYYIEPEFVNGTNVGEYDLVNETRNKIIFYVNSAQYNQQAEVTISNAEKIILKVRKTDKNTGTPLNASFVLRHFDSYAKASDPDGDGIWQIDEWLPYDTADAYEYYMLEDATKLELKNGEIQIEVPRDREPYALMEYKVPDGYSPYTLGYNDKESKNIYPMGTKYLPRNDTDEIGTVYGKVPNWLITEAKNAYKNLYNVELSDDEAIPEGIEHGVIWDEDRYDVFVFYVKDDMEEKENETDPDLEICLTNDKQAQPKELYISGYAWVDSSGEKTNGYNNEYNVEEGLRGVRVDLVNSATGVVEQTTQTVDGGFYRFPDKVVVENTADLDKYEIEFSYDSGYEVVPINDKDVGCKAVGCGTGKAGIYGLATRWLRYYSEAEQELKFMNLGLYTLPTPASVTTQELSYVKICMNNYNYLYDYEGTATEKYQKSNLPTVSYGSESSVELYRRPVYPSDIYQSQYGYDNWKNGGLEIYVVYKITVQNVNPITGLNVHEHYAEVASIVDEFDSNRYKLCTTTEHAMPNNNKENTAKATYGNWSGGGGSASYTKQELIEANQLTGCEWQNCKGRYVERYSGKDKYAIDSLTANQTTTVYIQFKMTENGIKEILDHGSEGVNEKYPTKATSNLQHYYDLYGHGHGKCGVYGCGGHSDTKKTHAGETSSDEAPYILFSLANKRKITGTVFNEGIIENGDTIKGDGKFTSTDGTVEGAVVELLDDRGSYNNKYKDMTDDYKVNTANGDVDKLEPAKIYYTENKDGSALGGLSAKDKVTAAGVPAVVRTNQDGYFEFKGVVPGEYYIRITYPNGKQLLVDSSTGVIQKSGNSFQYGNEEIITIHNPDGTTTEMKIPNYYKSTIIANGSPTKSVWKSGNTNDREWYRNNTEGYSVAVDNLKLREEYNKQYYNKIYSEAENPPEPTIKSMISTTPLFNIKVEDLATDTSKNVGSDGNILEEEEYPHFNFGIVRQPRQEASVEKYISSVVLMNNSQTVINGNPETDNLSGVSDLDSFSKEDGTPYENGGSTYTRTEIDSDTIYGSQLSVFYDLNVRNESEMNYYEDAANYGAYYVFGESSDSYSKVPQLFAKVDDYLDKLLRHIPGDNNTGANLTDNASDEQVETQKINVQDDSGAMVEKEFYQNVKNAIRNSLNSRDRTSSNPTELIEASELDKIMTEIEELGILEPEDYVIYRVMYHNLISKDMTETATLSATKILSELEKQWNYKNYAEIRQLKNTLNGDTSVNANNPNYNGGSTSLGLVITPEKLIYSNISRPEEAGEGSDDYYTKIVQGYIPEAEIVITTPTGGDKQSITLYVITGAIMLAILSVGVIIIKKKILM